MSLFKRAQSALTKGPLEFPNWKNDKDPYTKKEQLYWVKSQVLYQTPCQSDFSRVEGWHLSTGNIYSEKNGITRIDKMVNIALTAVSVNLKLRNFLLWQRQVNPVSHKAAQEARPLKIKGCQQLFAMFILKLGLAIQILDLTFTSVITTNRRLFL